TALALGGACAVAESARRVATARRRAAALVDAAVADDPAARARVADLDVRVSPRATWDLASAAESAADEPVDSIVVVSDGRDPAPVERARAAGERIAARGVRVDGVLVPRPTPPDPRLP